MSDEADPFLIIFNIGRTGAIQTCDDADEPRFLLAAFNNALQSARENNYIVQGAMYGPKGATIFIDTKDERWANKLDAGVPEDMKRKVSLDVHRAAVSSHVHAADQTSDIISDSSKQASVSIFKVGSSPCKHVFRGTDDNEPQIGLKTFIDTIHSILDKSSLVQGAMYGSEDEEAKIFMSADA